VDLVVCSHAVLAHVGLSAGWEVERIDVLATGHHYGTAPGEGAFTTMVRRDNLVSAYRIGGPDGRYCEADRFACRGDFDDIHQVAAWGDGLLVTNTGRNSLDYVRFQHDREGSGPDDARRHFFHGHRHDVNHVNSVFPCGDEQVLVLLNNKGAHPSEVAALSWDPERGFARTGTLTLEDMECHNVFADGDRLFTNASRSGDFVALDLAAGREIRRHRFPGYTKGLAVTREWVIVGYSDRAEREDRAHSRGYLAILERESLDLAACVDLNAAVERPVIGNVNEVRCLSEPDDGHGRRAPVVLPGA
jgi:hypothetical protein